MLVLPWTPGTQAEQTLQIAEQALEGGVNWVVLRIRGLPPTACTEVAYALRSLTHACRVLFSVNPYPAVAEWVGAEGVHLPESAPPFTSGELLVGRSVHSVEVAQRFSREGADYLLVGHIYETATHPDEPARGLTLIRTIRAEVPLPLIAIGGITPERVGEVLQAGARGVAVMSGITQSPDPKRSALAYAEALGIESTGA